MGIKLFSLLLMVVFAVLSAEAQEDEFRSKVSNQYQLTVTEVDPKELCFKLSNQMICNIPFKNRAIKIFPKVGDSVGFYPIFTYYDRYATHIEHGGLSVSFRSPDTQLQENIKVWVSGKFACPVVVRRDSIVTERDGLRDVYKEVLVLSDGSAWIRNEEKTGLYAPGDRIIVTVLGQNGYLLINLDKSSQIDEDDGWAWVTLAFEKVEPFDLSTITTE
ncbi:MAG TPA: hypothetical protein VHK67_04740 [Rhabdochlamydiaceae bacterium]|jgi:hypothetical protein|nr:hypothetical protein [Rhabdochlamydiaceae bacterium]